MPKIILIAAIDRNNAIGYENQLLFYIPSDLKRFKELTTGHTVLMGRKTFESLPKGALPNRKNVVLSKQVTTAYPNTELYTSLEDALESCSNDEKVFIIGGEQIYTQALSIADELELTEIDDEAKLSDAFFPEIDKTIWKEVNREEHSTDKFNYAYVKYVKA